MFNGRIRSIFSEPAAWSRCGQKSMDIPSKARSWPSATEPISCRSRRVYGRPSVKIPGTRSRFCWKRGSILRENRLLRQAFPGAGMNFYSIRHLTRFRYKQPVSESIMETRMHPRSDHSQHCLFFTLSVSPRCRVFSYRDQYGNNVHHFDIPGEHDQLVIVAESLVEQQIQMNVPAFLAPDAWSELDALIAEGDYGEMLLPSTFAIPTPAL